MLNLHLFLLLVAAVCVQSVPLNINLGAYSPALVVGDGEISFGGEESVENLMTTLEGTSQAGGEAAGAEGGERPTGLEQAQIVDGGAKGTAIVSAASEASPTVVATEANPTIADSETSPSLPNGDGIGKKDIEPREPETMEKRDLAGFDAALDFAGEALKTGPGVELGTGEGGSGIGIIVEPGVDNPEGTVVGKRTTTDSQK